jgi:beta-lactam-binding protein with PASTA domain
MWKYLLSKEFRITLLILASAGLLALLILFYGILPAYTRQGQVLVVPDVTGLDADEASHMLETSSLRFELDTLYDFNPRYPALAVIKQDPPPNSKVKPGRKIYLSINRQAASKIVFPNVIDKSLFEARSELEKWGLKVGRIQYVEGEFANLVEQASHKGRRMKTGDQIDKYASIDLTVSKGPGSMVEYISVSGMDVGEAMNALQMNGLIGIQIQYDPASKESPGAVVRQFPVYHNGDSLQRGTTIHLWVAGEEPEEVAESLE